MAEMGEKTKAARDKLRQSLKENPEYAKAFKETVEELRKPENVKKQAQDIMKVFNAIKPYLKKED